MVQEKITMDRREFYGLQKAIAIAYQQENVSIIQRLTGTEKERLVFNHTIVNEKNRKEINHIESHHTQCVQRSKYLQIDSDIMNPKKLDPHGGKKVNQNHISATVLKSRDIQDMAGTLNLKYCLSKQVQHNQSQFLHFKENFCQRQAHLKSLGKTIEQMGRLEIWVEKNFPVLSKHFEQEYAKEHPQFSSTKPQSEKERSQFMSWILIKIETLVSERRKLRRRK